MRSHQPLVSRKPPMVFLLVSMILLVSLTACGAPVPTEELALTPQVYVSPTPSPTATLENTATPTQQFTPTPIPPPLGLASNPVVLGIIYSDQAVQEPAAIEFLQYLADQTGYVFKISVFENTFDLLAGMDAGTVTFAFMQPITYIYAHNNDVATVKLITRSFGVTAFGTQILAKADSGFAAYYNEETEKNSADAGSALNQFYGKRPCFVDETSLSGAILPFSLLTQNAVEYSEPVYVHSNTAVIRALYIGGVCDFGATYAITSDPRTSSDLEDLGDAMEKVVVVWRSDAIIPTLNISFTNKSNPEVTANVAKSIQEFSNQETGIIVLTSLTGTQVEAMETASDALYTSLSQILEGSGIDLLPYLGY